MSKMYVYDGKIISPEPKAHWIHRASWSKYVCSECSFEYDKPERVCPNCKSRMINVLKAKLTWR